MERLRQVKQLVNIGLLTIALAGCVPANTEAYTTPFGIVYNTPNPDSKIIAHEEAHWERVQKEGLGFWFNYWTDPNFRCAEEIRANTIAGIEPADDHPYCKTIYEQSK